MSPNEVDGKEAVEVKDNTMHAIRIPFAGKSVITILFGFRDAIEKQQIEYKPNLLVPTFMPWCNCLEPVNDLIQKILSNMLTYHEADNKSARS